MAGVHGVSRYVRFYGKKRGARRVGSRRLASIGEALIFASFLAVGCASFVLIFMWLIYPEWRAQRTFQPHRAVVVDRRIDAVRPGESAQHRPEIQIEYELAGKTYKSWVYDLRGEYIARRGDVDHVLEQFPVGAEVAMWYDPADPAIAVLILEFNRYVWFTLLVPLALIATGGVGLVYRLFDWGRSSERKAVLAGRLGEVDLFADAHAAHERFPTIPAGADLTNSPGTRLAYRLPIDIAPGWRLLAIAAACVAWNGAMAALVWLIVRDHLADRPDWLLTVFSLPFLGVGGWLIYLLAHKLLAVTRAGPTLVEISAHPLRPGAEVRLFVCQMGRLHFDLFRVVLACDERASYCMGTDTRTETRRVAEHEILRRERVEVEQGRPLEAFCEFAVDSAAMHSFRAQHNVVEWKIVVRGIAAGRPDYERTYPVLVHPGALAEIAV